MELVVNVFVGCLIVDRLYGVGSSCHLAGSDHMLRFSRNRNLAVSSVNNGMMFLIWTLPSVLSVMLQSAHDADPSVYHFEGPRDSLQTAVPRGALYHQ